MAVGTQGLAVTLVGRWAGTWLAKNSVMSVRIVRTLSVVLNVLARDILPRLTNLRDMVGLSLVLLRVARSRVPERNGVFVVRSIRVRVAMLLGILGPVVTFVRKSSARVVTRIDLVSVALREVLRPAVAPRRLLILLSNLLGIVDMAIVLSRDVSVLTLRLTRNTGIVMTLVPVPSLTLDTSVRTLVSTSRTLMCAMACGEVRGYICGMFSVVTNRETDSGRTCRLALTVERVSMIERNSGMTKNILVRSRHRKLNTTRLLLSRGP